jgi:hypothetical protein
MMTSMIHASDGPADESGAEVRRRLAGAGELSIPGSLVPVPPDPQLLHETGSALRDVDAVKPPPVAAADVVRLSVRQLGGFADHSTRITAELAGHEPVHFDIDDIGLLAEDELEALLRRHVSRFEPGPDETPREAGVRKEKLRFVLPRIVADVTAQGQVEGWWPAKYEPPSQNRDWPPIGRGGEPPGL